jgi:hypothetical protein
LLVPPCQIEKRNKEKEEQRQDKKRRFGAFRDLLERTPGIKVCNGPSKYACMVGLYCTAWLLVEGLGGCAGAAPECTSIMPNGCPASG